jgi:Cu(I)/Ag(I) efflux system membrane protein CusA/SilA
MARTSLVGGVVIMRFGEDAQKVIERVKQRITDIWPTLPKGLKIVTTMTVPT